MVLLINGLIAVFVAVTLYWIYCAFTKSWLDNVIKSVVLETSVFALKKYWFALFAIVALGVVK